MDWEKYTGRNTSSKVADLQKLDRIMVVNQTDDLKIEGFGFTLVLGPLHTVKMICDGKNWSIDRSEDKPSVGESVSWDNMQVIIGGETLDRVEHINYDDDVDEESEYDSKFPPFIEVWEQAFHKAGDGATYQTMIKTFCEVAYEVLKKAR